MDTHGGKIKTFTLSEIQANAILDLRLRFIARLEEYKIIDEQKEVIRIIVSEEQADRVFEAMYLAGGLDTPGKGIMFMTKLERVATYIPESVLKEIA